MSLQDFIEKSTDRYRKQGPSILPSIGVDFVMSALARMPVVPQFGTNVFEREWDVLLILDACRYDMYQQIIRNSDRIWSVGSSSDEWMDHTFTDEYADELARTAYVTGNPFSDDRCPAHQLAHVNEVWRHEWDDERGTIYPQPITDHVIARHRDGYDRVIGHYMQPHYPFIGEKTSGDEKMQWNIIDDESHTGEGLALWDQFLYAVRDDFDAVRQAYDDNLRHVFPHVETVCENVDGRVVVTADHGNALGEWGIWGHKPGMVHPKMRHVPWDTYECTDRETHVPQFENTETSTTDRDEQLRSLGYL